MSELSLPTHVVEHLTENERNLIRSFRLLGSHTQSAVHRFVLLEAGARDGADLDEIEADIVAGSEKGLES